MAALEKTGWPKRVDLCRSHIRCDRRSIEVCVGPGSATFGRSTSRARLLTIDNFARLYLLRWLCPFTEKRSMTNVEVLRAFYARYITAKGACRDPRIQEAF